MEEEVFDIEDSKFEQLLADKQHRQLMGALRQLISSIKNDQESDTKISQSITKYNQDLSLLLGKIEKVLDKPQKELPTPQVNLTNNNTELTASIGLLTSEMESVCEGQNKIIELLSLKPTRLKPVSSYGRIDYVDVVWEDITKQKTIKR